MDKSPGQAPEVPVSNSEGTAQPSVSFRNEQINNQSNQMIVS